MNAGTRRIRSAYGVARVALVACLAASGCSFSGDVDGISPGNLVQVGNSRGDVGSGPGTGDATAGSSGDESCTTLAAAAEAAFETAAGGCDAVDDCVLFDWPPDCTMVDACFFRAIRADANTSALEAALGAAETAACAGYTCECNLSFGWPACLSGACRVCPPDCGSSCDDLAAAIDARLAIFSRGCTTDADCVLIETNVCEVGEYVACQGIAVYKEAANGLDGTGVLEFIDAYRNDPSLDCGASRCGCKANTARCVSNVCRPVAE